MISDNAFYFYSQKSVNKQVLQISPNHAQCERDDCAPRRARRDFVSVKGSVLIGGCFLSPLSSLSFPVPLSWFVCFPFFLLFAVSCFLCPVSSFLFVTFIVPGSSFLFPLSSSPCAISPCTCICAAQALEVASRCRDCAQIWVISDGDADDAVLVRQAAGPLSSRVPIYALVCGVLLV